LSIDEQRAVIESPNVSTNEKHLIEFAWEMGLRPAELFALRWSDCTLDGPRPGALISRSWRENDPTKSEKSWFVSFTPRALDVLRSWRERCPTPNGLVFPTVTGLPRRKGNDGGWGDRVGAHGVVKLGIKSRAGITRRVTFYSASRDTCASNLLMGKNGPPLTLAEVAAWIGHSIGAVTERYARVSVEHIGGKAAQMTRDPWVRIPVGHAIQVSTENTSMESPSAPGWTRTSDIRLRRPNGSPDDPLGYESRDPIVTRGEIRAYAMLEHELAARIERGEDPEVLS